MSQYLTVFNTQLKTHFVSTKKHSALVSIYLNIMYNIYEVHCIDFNPLGIWPGFSLNLLMNRFVHNKWRLGLNSLFKLLAPLQKPANVFEMLRHVKYMKCLRVCSAELWAGRAVCLLGGVCVVWQVPRSSRRWIKILAWHCWHCMHTRNGLINSARVKGRKGVKKEGKGLWTHWQSALTLCLLQTTQHAPYLQLTDAANSPTCLCLHYTSDTIYLVK